MKGRFLIVALMLTSLTAWAADEKTTATPASKKAAAVSMTKEDILQEVKKGCVQSGNTEAACDCSVKGFDEKITKQEWDLLVKPPQEIKQTDIESFKAIEAKMYEVASGCGAKQ